MNPVEVKNLSKVFRQAGRPDFIAVDHVSFEVHKGETLGIVGESGSGKSTIAKLITRLTDATEGEILIDGKDISKADKRGMREIYGKIQMVFQNPAGSFDPRRTLGYGIGESLRTQRMPKTEAAKRVRELLEEVIDLTEYVKELEAEDTEESRARIETIDELISKTESYQEAMEEKGEPATLSGFLEEIALVADIDSVDPDQDYVLLMTLHSAKGLEFPRVFLAGMEPVEIFNRQGSFGIQVHP